MLYKVVLTFVSSDEIVKAIEQDFLMALVVFQYFTK